MPPRGVSRADFGKQGEEYMNPTDYARSKGVVGLIYVPDFQYLANWQRNRQRIMERGSTVVAKFQSKRPAAAIDRDLTGNSKLTLRGRGTDLLRQFSMHLLDPTPPASFLMSDAKEDHS